MRRAKVLFERCFEVFSAPLVCPVLFSITLATAGLAAPRIEVQGHRGARALRPENTLPAFELALNAGVDTLELDVGVTKDNVLVVSHDQVIPVDLCLAPGSVRVSGEVPIHSLTLEQVKQYDCGSLRHPNFPTQLPVPGTRIPTLDEVFALVKSSKAAAAKTVQFNIETKLAPRPKGRSPDAETFARLVVDALRRHGMVSRTVLQSFDHRSLIAAKKMEPSLRLSPLLNMTWVDMVGVLRAVDGDIVSPHFDWVSAADVKAVHAAGKRIIPWTANKAEDWDYLIRIGVDGIITDDPQALIAYLKAKGLR